MAEFSGGLGSVYDEDGGAGPFPDYGVRDADNQGAGRGPAGESFSERAMPQGNAGTLSATVPELVAAVRKARGHPHVRQTALRVIATCGNTPEARIVALYNWVRDSVRYVPDPDDVEFVTTPEKLLELVAKGEAWEDCESMVTLLASLMESIGIRTRFVLTQNNPRTSEYTHIFLEAQGTGGKWHALDPTPPYREAGQPVEAQRGRRVIPIGAGLGGLDWRLVAGLALAGLVGYAAWRAGQT